MREGCSNNKIKNAFCELLEMRSIRTRSNCRCFIYVKSDDFTFIHYVIDFSKIKSTCFFESYEFFGRLIPLPHSATYPIIRKLNQTAVLSLFEKWLRLASEASKQALLERLQVPANKGRGWTGPCTSERMRRAKLIEFKQNNPLKWDSLEIPLTVFAIK